MGHRSGRLIGGPQLCVNIAYSINVCRQSVPELFNYLRAVMRYNFFGQTKLIRHTEAYAWPMLFLQLSTTMLGLEQSQE